MSLLVWLGFLISFGLQRADWRMFFSLVLNSYIYCSSLHFLIIWLLFSLCFTSFLHITSCINFSLAFPSECGLRALGFPFLEQMEKIYSSVWDHGVLWDQKDDLWIRIFQTMGKEATSTNSKFGASVYIHQHLLAYTMKWSCCKSFTPCTFVSVYILVFLFSIQPVQDCLRLERDGGIYSLLEMCTLVFKILNGATLFPEPIQLCFDFAHNKIMFCCHLVFFL